MSKTEKILEPLRDPIIGICILLSSFGITGALTYHQLNQEHQAASIANKSGIDESGEPKRVSVAYQVDKSLTVVAPKSSNSAKVIDGLHSSDNISQFAVESK